VTKKVHTEGE